MSYIIAINPLHLIDRDIALAQAVAYLLCPHCHHWYLLRPGALALTIEGDEAIVRPGWVEICPLCYCESDAGTRLALRAQKEVKPAD